MRWRRSKRPPLPIAEAQELLRRVTYKGGTTFSLDDEGVLRIQIEVASVPGSNVDWVCATVPPPAKGWADLDAFIFWVGEAVVATEHHEAMEWFRIDGHAPYYPHDAEPLPPWSRNVAEEESEDGRTNEDRSAIRGSAETAPCVFENVTTWPNLTGVVIV